MAADLGCRLMLPSVFGRPEQFVQVADMFRERWEANGKDWADARVGACSHIHVGRTTQEARTTWEPYYRSYWEFVGGLLGEGSRWPAFDFDELLAGPGICGSPAEVLDRIGTWRELLGLDRHLLMFDLGGIEEELLEQTLDLFGAEVAPSLLLDPE